MTDLDLGGYRISRTVAEGAFSTIYEATHEAIGRSVAIKTLKASIAPTSSFATPLAREASLLSQLAHPNIVLLLDAGKTSNGHPYVVLEWIDGVSLDALVQSKAAPRATAPLPLASALAIGVGISAALEHLHEHGIVHRDIKPSNILVSRAGHAKLIDFGIAQRPRTRDGNAANTEGLALDGTLTSATPKDGFGTPAYMSPEQLLGDFVDVRSDLYSLGVVLYTLIAGSHPLAAKGKADDRSRRDSPASLRDRAPECPWAVERIVMRLLEPSPEDRYPTPSIVRERLEHALRSETREDPTHLLRALFSKRPASPTRAPLPSAMSLSRTGVGLLAIAGVFALGVTAIELTSGDARAMRSVGSQPLALLPQDKGGLRVVASPWADVSVDGQHVETTPFSTPIPLSAGPHFVVLAHPSQRAATERQVTITKGEVLMLDVTMDLLAEEPTRGSP